VTDWRPLFAPGLAALVAFALLVGLGTWQLRRLAFKEALIAQIAARSHGAPGAIVPEAQWGHWRAADDEFRVVRLGGTFEHRDEALVHGLSAGERAGTPTQGFFLFTPLRLPDGGRVLVDRGFIPTELRDPAARPQSRPEGEVTLTGLVRAPEARSSFTPADVPAQSRFFVKDPGTVAAAKGLERVAPFYVAADATPNPGGWPRGGGTRLNLPNNHLQYALTWYGIAATLLGVAAAFVLNRLGVGRGRSLAGPDRGA
jgi:surfeit locus 1 family protein